MYETVITRDGRIVRTVSPSELIAEWSLGMHASVPAKARSGGGRSFGGRRQRRLGGILGVLTLMLVAVSGVFAVHNQDFELDGNAADTAAGLPDDWANVFAGTDSALESVFVTDPLGGQSAPDEIFHQGGSKDDLDIRAGGIPGATIGPWRHTIGNVPDKDNIEHAFAAAYGCDDFVNPDPGSDEFEDPGTDPDLCLYFGLDRFARNGDAQVGFWFFGTEHALNADGTFSNPHAFGDLLVLSDFTNGGVVSTIRVFRWVGIGGDTNGTLDNIFNGVACGAPPVDPACALANTSNQPSPWPYTPKSGTADVFPPGSFFEGGLNLSALGLDIGCGAGFLAETRSSQSVDAQLKDFALGAFELCGLDVVKTGDDLSKVGDAADYTVTIENTGSVTLYKDDITDDVLGAITLNGVDQVNSNVISNGCGASLAAGATCTITLARTTQAGDPDPLVNTVTAVYNANSALTGADVSDFDDHSLNLFQPSITLDKTGDTLSKIGDSVDYTITFNNTSSADTPDLTCDFSDSVLGTLDQDVVVASGDPAYVITTSRVVDALDPDPLVNTASVTCTVGEGFGNVLTGSEGHSTNLFVPGVEVIKDGPATGFVGGLVTYDFTITNTSSSDAPDLILESVIDTVIGDITAQAIAGGCATLATPGGSCNFSVGYIILASDPNPLTNVVTVLYHPEGFPNDVTDDDDHTLTIPNEGCTPGFWKRWTNVWDDTGDAIPTAIDAFVVADGDPLTILTPGAPPALPSAGTGSAFFKNTFGITDAQMTAAGLSTNLTLLEAINTGGGQFEALVRHGTAALLNSAAVNYPFSTAQVIAGVQAAFANDDSNFNGFLDAISDANELPHDSCPKSDPSD